MSDKIFIYGMEFYGYHGLFPEESRLGQRFVVDLELFMDLKPVGTSGDLNCGVDYSLVYDRVRTLVETKVFALIETLAEEIASDLLSNFNITGVKVRVHKPQAPVKGVFSDLGVEIYRGGNHG